MKTMTKLLAVGGLLAGAVAGALAIAGQIALPSLIESVRALATGLMILGAVIFAVDLDSSKKWPVFTLFLVAHLLWIGIGIDAEMTSLIVLNAVMLGFDIYAIYIRVLPRSASWPSAKRVQPRAEY